MRILYLTADDGEKLTGHLPESWAEVPLQAYAQLAAADTIPTRLEALAGLVGLPAQPLLEDVSLAATIFEAVPWLQTELPEATGAVPEFKHLGTRYVHIGHLHKISGGQLEALTDFVQAGAGSPLASAPGLLAVLYCPARQPQTREVVVEARAALASLPMSIAWPALADFMQSSASAALNIQTASALVPQAEAALTNLENALQTTGASGTFFLNMRRSLARILIKRVKQQL